MRDINRTLLLGRLGTDPVLRHTKSGIPVANFSLATETYNKSKNESDTTWHRIVLWGKTAELVNQELKKGMAVFLEGGNRVRKYENEEGETHYIHEIHADRVHFLHRKAKVQNDSHEAEVLVEEEPSQYSEELPH